MSRSVLPLFGLFLTLGTAHGQLQTPGPAPSQRAPLGMQFGPVPGFTTAAHRAPTQLVLPLLSHVPIAVTGLRRHETVIWDDELAPVAYGSQLLLPCSQPGPMTLGCTVQPGDQRLECEVYVAPLTPASLHFSADVRLARPVESGHYGNAEAVQIWKRRSIGRLLPLAPAALGGLTLPGNEAPQRYAVAVDTPLSLLVAAAEPLPLPPHVRAGATSLVEWRQDGVALGVGAVPTTLGLAGTHRFEAGPPGSAARIDVTAYRVVLSSDTPVGLWQDGQPIHWSATTQPSGFESNVTWLAATKYGAAAPMWGRGASFTTTFHNTFGPGVQGSSTWQWTGVLADSSTDGQDTKCTVSDISAGPMVDDTTSCSAQPGPPIDAPPCLGPTITANPIKVVIKTAVPAGKRDDVQAAFDEWETNTDVDFDICVQDDTAGANIVVKWDAGKSAGTTVALNTTTVQNCDDGTQVHLGACIQLWAQDKDCNAFSDISVYNATLHECGHSIGLDHDDGNDGCSCMVDNAACWQNGGSDIDWKTTKKTLSDTDKAAVNGKY